MKLTSDFISGYSVPIQKLRFSPNNNSIKVMRDDLYPVAFGGNKARKTEIFFDDILQDKSIDTVVTYGSSSSNHCRTVACLCSKFHLDCIIVSPSEQSENTSNVKLNKIFGAKTVECPVSEVSLVIEQTIENLRKSGKNPYFIYGGGHGNLGTLAYERVFDEILKIEKDLSIKFDYIFHASGTGTTQAGLVSGKIKRKENVNIVGISIARRKPYGRDVVVQSVKDFLKLDGVSEIDKHIVFVDDYVNDGYGVYSQEQLLLMTKMLQQEGLPLDHTYTGKAFYGMVEYLTREKIYGKNILFIHTGGTPLFYDDLEKMV